MAVLSKARQGRRGVGGSSRSGSSGSRAVASSSTPARKTTQPGIRQARGRDRGCLPTCGDAVLSITFVSGYSWQYGSDQLGRTTLSLVERPSTISTHFSQHCVCMLPITLSIASSFLGICCTILHHGHRPSPALPIPASFASAEEHRCWLFAQTSPHPHADPGQH